MRSGKATVAALVPRPCRLDNSRQSGPPGMCGPISRLACEQSGNANSHPARLPAFGFAPFYREAMNAQWAVEVL